MKIVRMRPYCTGAIWGGKKLKARYGKEADFDVAEAWELSGYPGKESRVSGGELDGMTLGRLIDTFGRGILGSKAKDGEGFPIIIKFIDSAAPLSIQVHPDDKNAKLLGADGGKTEMWIICEAEKDAYIYFGVKDNIKPETFAEAISDGTITERLNKIYVNPGDTFFIKAGTVHAIGAGITLCEIQQTSDTTYRLYDYDRVDAGGKKRELHIEKGKIASCLIPPDHFYEKGERIGNENILVTCDYFTVSRVDVNGKSCVTVGDDSFSSFTVTQGSGSIECCEDRLRLKKGDTVFAFAGAGELALDGNMTVIRSKL